MSCVRGCCPDEATHFKNVSFISPETMNGNEKDRVLAKNRDAYYRLRHQGLHPPSIDSSAELESRAVDQFEIDTGKLYKDAEERKKVKEGYEKMQLHQLGVA